MYPSISSDETFDRSEVSEGGGGNPSGLAGSLPVIQRKQTYSTQAK